MLHIESVINPNNIVMCASLSSSINLEALSKLLTCTHVPFTLQSKKGKTIRKIVPWFGEDGIILSVKYKEESRGIRKGCGYSFPTAIGTDFQSLSKNHYLKIYNINLHLCGALSWSSGINSFHSMIDFIKMVNDIWVKFRNQPRSVQINTIKWLFKNIVKDEENVYMWNDPIFVEILENLKLSQESENNKIIKNSRFGKNNDDISILEIENSNEIVYPIDIDTIEYFSMFTYDYPEKSTYIKMVYSLLDLKTLDGLNYAYSEIPRIINPYIILGRYNFKLDIKIKMSLIDLCMYLYSKGYSALFCNFPNMRKILRVIYVESVETESPKSVALLNDEEIVEGKRVKKDKIVAHRFEIKQNGSCQQTSPSSTQAAQIVRNKLINEIYNYLKQRNQSYN